MRDYLLNLGNGQDFRRKQGHCKISSYHTRRCQKTHENNGRTNFGICRRERKNSSQDRIIKINFFKRCFKLHSFVFSCQIIEQKGQIGKLQKLKICNVQT